jgi:hypothetical protein
MTHFQNQSHDTRTVVLSEAQFNKLVELLTPGYEMAKFYMAQAEPPRTTPEQARRQETVPPPKSTAPVHGTFEVTPPPNPVPSDVLSTEQPSG